MGKGRALCRTAGKHGIIEDPPSPTQTTETTDQLLHLIPVVMMLVVVVVVVPYYVPGALYIYSNTQNCSAR